MSHIAGGRLAIESYRAPATPPHPAGAAAAAAAAESHATARDLHGLSFAEGLPAFEGGLAAATLAQRGGAGAIPPAAYLAVLCHEGLAAFRQQHAWDPALTHGVETALRAMALQCTPTPRDLEIRLRAMSRLKELARSGIDFCVGLDLEPYGSFVSGLYTPAGDLDLSIEGQAIWQDQFGYVRPQVTVDMMGREMRIRFLRALASRIQGRGLCVGQVDRILHARVPILKFKDASGLDFDVGIGGSHALFKSTVLGLLAHFDWRFGALVRLVKLWARRHDVNDSTNGTLNSFALTLLVVFHLQTRSPAVLPPLCQLFGVGPEHERLMQEGRFPDFGWLKVASERLVGMAQQGGPSLLGANSETLLELLASFFALYDSLLTGGWAATKGEGAAAMRGVLRRVRVDTWGGRLRYQRWDRDGYCCSIEDPFDTTDNCARTVRHEDKMAHIAQAVSAGRTLLAELDNPQRAAQALQTLFPPEALLPGQLRDFLLDERHPAVEWVPPVDLIIPPRIQAFTQGHSTAVVHVDHRRIRGVPGQPDCLQAVQQQLQQLSLPASPAGSPPSASSPPAASPAASPPGLAQPVQTPVVPGLAPGAAVPGVGWQQQAQQEEQQPAAGVMSLQGLRRLMDGEVQEEAARLAEEARKQAEAAALQAAAREEKKAAKRAAAKAAREAKAEERRRERAERAGRSRSRSRSRGSRSRSRSAGSNNGSGAAARLSAVAAASSAAAAALASAGNRASQPSGSQAGAALPTAEPAPETSSAVAAALANWGQLGVQASSSAPQQAKGAAAVPAQPTAAAPAVAPPPGLRQPARAAPVAANGAAQGGQAGAGAPPAVEPAVPAAGGGAAAGGAGRGAAGGKKKERWSNQKKKDRNAARDAARTLPGVAAPVSAFGSGSSFGPGPSLAAPAADSQASGAAAGAGRQRQQHHHHQQQGGQEQGQGQPRWNERRRSRGGRGSGGRGGVRGQGAAPKVVAGAGGAPDAPAPGTASQGGSRAPVTVLRVNRGQGRGGQGAGGQPPLPPPPLA